MGFVFKLCICSKLVFLHSSLLYCYDFAGVKICRTGDLLSGLGGALCQGSAKWACDADSLGQHLREMDGPWVRQRENRRGTGCSWGTNQVKLGHTRHFLNSLLPLKFSNWQKLSRNHPVLRRTEDMSLLHSGRQFVSEA